MNYLCLKKQIQSVLVIAPKSVYTVWQNEIEIHLPDEIKNRVVALSIMQPNSPPVSGVGMRSAVDKFWVYI